MHNATGAPRTIVAILAVYNSNDELAGCEVMPLTVGTDASANTFTFEGIYANPAYINTTGCKTKMFVFDSMENITPLEKEFYLWQNVDANGGEGQPVWQ